MRKLVLLLLLLTACSHPKPEASTLSIRETVPQWLSNHQDNLEQLSEDVELVEAGADTGETDIVAATCKNFHYDLEAARSELPSPDTEINDLLGQAYGIWIKAAESCIRGRLGVTTTLLYHGTQRMQDFSDYVDSL